MKEADSTCSIPSMTQLNVESEGDTEEGTNTETEMMVDTAVSDTMPGKTGSDKSMMKNQGLMLLFTTMTKPLLRIEPRGRSLDKTLLHLEVNLDLVMFDLEEPLAKSYFPTVEISAAEDYEIEALRPFVVVIEIKTSRNLKNQAREDDRMPRPKIVKAPR